jgi:hypothetical protein
MKRFYFGFAKNATYVANYFGETFLVPAAYLDRNYLIVDFLCCNRLLGKSRVVDPERGLSANLGRLDFIYKKLIKLSINISSDS